MGRRPKISREDVLQAAREAFAERGFEGTTLAGIASRLGVSPAALLRHAPTKEALFASAMSYHGPGEFPVPVEFLAELDGSEDPRLVVRRIGETFVPFLEAKLDEQIARWMRDKTATEEARGFPLPFDPNIRPTPPQRVLRLVEDYLRRASAAGRLRVSDPLAAALMLFGSFQAYVMLHRIARILEPPLPLDRYIDTVVEVWMRGAGGSEEGEP
jgi:AcrR family transcriptional regulator